MASRTAYSAWTPQKPTLFSGHYLRNRSTLDIGVLGYIGIVQHKEHSPEVLSIPPGTPCIYIAKVRRLFPVLSHLKLVHASVIRLILIMLLFSTSGPPK